MASSFVDEVELYAKAGDGGTGIVAWRREAHVPKGGPAGGDGGDGGDVVLVGDEGVHSLLDFTYNPHLKAKNGQPGRGKRQAGENGASASAKVPIGTQVFDADTGEFIADVTAHEQRVVICRGGNGGWGNTHFTTPSRQAPEISKPGLPGGERRIRLSLKLMADVGLLGFPNAGKSTFLSRVSAARPKIAAYPFTTLTPQLGVVRSDFGDGGTFVIADIPGLIEGAAEGAGLGVQFLKHLERVRVICHLIEVPLEIAGGVDGADWGDEAHHKTRGPVDLVERYEALRTELGKFNEDLVKVPEVVVINKTDLLDHAADNDNVKKLAKHLAKQAKKRGGDAGALLFMSGATGDGLKSVVRALDERVRTARGVVVKASFNPFARVRYPKHSA